MPGVTLRRAVRGENVAAAASASCLTAGSGGALCLELLDSSSSSAGASVLAGISASNNQAMLGGEPLSGGLMPAERTRTEALHWLAWNGIPASGVT
jgi:hypothetical protein